MLFQDQRKPDCIVDIDKFDSYFVQLNLKKEDRIMFKLDVEQMEPEAIVGSKSFIQSFPDITFVIEEKHSGAERIRKALLAIADFEFGIVDSFNIYARKK